MFKRSIGRKVLFLVSSLILLAQAGYAIMPPRVYRKAIRESSIKAVARVKSVTVYDRSELYVRKKVVFELIKSYGPVTPKKEFVGYCESATDKPIVGGTIYYYPNVGEVAFVTLGGNSLAGYFTSYTLLTPELSDTLERDGLSGLKYGIGEVYVKNKE